MLKRYFNNIISSAIFQLVSIIVGLIVPLLILKAYGSVLNGLLNSIKQMVSYLSLVEAGIGAVSIAALYKPLTEKDNQQISGIVSAARIFYNRSGLVFSLLVLLLSLLFPILVKSQIDIVHTIALVIVVGISGTLEFFIIGKYKVLLTSDQREYVILNIQSAGLLLNMALTVLFVKLGLDLIIVQMGSALVFLFRALAIRAYIHSHYKEISFTAKPNNERISQRWDALVHQISGLVVFNTDILLLTIFSTLKEVSVYAIYKLIFTAIGQLPTVFSAGVSPALGRMNNLLNKQGFESKYSQFEVLYYMVLSFIYSVCFLLFIPFITIYTAGVNDTNYLRPELMTLFLLGEVLCKIRVPSNFLVNINGLYKETKTRAILEAVINLSLSLVLVRRYGIAGVLLGTIVSYLYRTTDFIVFASRIILNRTIFKSFRMILINCTLAVVSIYVSKIFTTTILTTYVQWLIEALRISSITFVIVLLGNTLFNWNTLKHFFSYVGKKIKQRPLFNH